MDLITSVVLAVLGGFTIACSVAELFIESSAQDFLTNFTIALGGVCGAAVMVLSIMSYA